jgi:hypothetical protein
MRNSRLRGEDATMADLDETTQCPLCSGHGTLAKEDILTRLGDPAWIEDQLHQAARQAVGAGNGGRDFQKEVHSWNPQLPMWRRSNKE